MISVAEVARHFTPDVVAMMTEEEKREAADLLAIMEGDEVAHDLRAYIRAAWRTVDPSEYIGSWHLDAIADHLEGVTSGDIRKLIINVPPRTGKSNLASVFWPTWEWASKPSTRWMFGSYSGKLSNKHSVERRIVIDSDWYQARWGHRFQLSSDQNVKTEFTNTQKGSMFATSIGGTATGHGGDRVLLDDPHNVEEAESDDVRESVIEAWKKTFSTRLNDPKTGAFVVIMQRLHARDLTGYLLREEGDWTHLCLPMEYEKKHFAVYARDPRKEEGDLLCPERFGPEEVAAGKRRLGTYGTAGQYQQRPSSAVGEIFQRGWWKFYDLPEDPTALAAWLVEMDGIGQSWDLSFKDLKTSDFVAGLAAAKKGGNLYLLDLIHGQMGFSATCNAIEAFSAKWPMISAKWVEDKANGPAVIDALHNRVPGLIAVEPRGSKFARAQASSPFVESGNVYLPRGAAWVSDFIEELADFPKGVHDDRVDAFSQAADRLLTSADLAVLDYYSKLNRDREAEAKAKAEAENVVES